MGNVVDDGSRYPEKPRTGNEETEQWEKILLRCSRTRRDRCSSRYGRRQQVDTNTTGRGVRVTVTVTLQLPKQRTYLPGAQYLSTYTSTTDTSTCLPSWLLPPSDTFKIWTPLPPSHEREHGPFCATPNTQRKRRSDLFHFHYNMKTPPQKPFKID